MGTLDYLVVGVYFAAVLFVGFWYQRRASKNLDSYFLGEKRLHWLALSMAGAVSNYDITGTMWIISLLYVLGMRSMWNHWMWGWLMGAFFLAYMGKWVQRSRVLTGAEWMLTRFGGDRPGRVARSAYALLAVITLASFIGYDFQGIGKFGSVYLPLEPWLCGVLIIGITTLYALLGGLFSVVVSDVIQTVILTIASIVIAIVAYLKLTPAALSALPADWGSVVPKWKLPEMATYANPEYVPYEFFGVLVIVWVLKGLLLNAGGPAQMYDFQRFLAAKDARDAAKVGATWSLFLVVRWALCAGIVLLALTLLRGQIGSERDVEKVMPLVLKEYLPPGLRGIVVAGLLAAFMSTFSGTVNAAASYIVRDFWQALVRPNAGQKHLVRASYAATIGIVLVGIAIGLQAKSIKQIWDWLMMALGAGVVIPNVLRWYWWRMNGWGYTAGTLGGILLALVPLAAPGLPLYVTFPVICAGSLVACVAVTFLTAPVPEATLVKFYRIVRPFGIWGPVRAQSGLSPEELRSPGENVWLSLSSVVLGMVAITGLYLSPMYLVGHWHAAAAAWMGAAVLACLGLYFTWYRHLPPPEES
jgi:solute:Na+ symporter, SSS family